MYTAQKNKTKFCFACHQPAKLREKLWAHDVHAMKLPCASCHTLHPKDDAMKGIQPKNRVKLCVDCHGEQQNAKRQKTHNHKRNQPNKRINNDSLFTPKLCFRHGALILMTGTSVTSLAKEEKADKPKRYAMVHDETACIGCTACMDACRETNHVPEGVSRLEILRSEPLRRIPKSRIRVFPSILPTLYKRPLRGSLSNRCIIY